MIDFVLLVFFGVMAVRIAQSVRRESAIYREFNQSQSLGYLVFLFPLGPALFLTTIFRLGWVVALVLVLACYLPSFLVARRHLSIFERAGTDRVKGAESAASQAYGTAIVGFIYAGLLLAFMMASSTQGGASA
jgi:Ca2+/Na+ antiporter